MATRNEAIEILETFKKLGPMEILKDIQGVNEGTRFVLGYLDDHSKYEVYASSLCEAMSISRARMSVLIDKLVQKKLITKNVSATDARKEVISLTEQGKQLVKQKKEELETKVMFVIDKLGIEKIKDFAETAKQIKSIMLE